jgi:hypothetical protein
MLRLTPTRALVVAAVAAAGLALATAQACHERPASPPPPASTPTPSPTPTLSAVQRERIALAAALVVRDLVKVVDQGRLGQARRLLAAPGVWPAVELRAIRSARVVTIRPWGRVGAGSLTLLARLRVAVGRGSPLSDGAVTLFFTLRRDGSSGDWLVTAVGTSP